MRSRVAGSRPQGALIKSKTAQFRAGLDRDYADKSTAKPQSRRQTCRCACWQWECARALSMHILRVMSKGNVEYQGEMSNGWKDALPNQVEIKCSQDVWSISHWHSDISSMWKKKTTVSTRPCSCVLTHVWTHIHADVHTRTHTLPSDCHVHLNEWQKHTPAPWSLSEPAKLRCQNRKTVTGLKNADGLQTRESVWDSLGPEWSWMTVLAVLGKYCVLLSFLKLCTVHASLCFRNSLSVTFGCEKVTMDCTV